MHNKDCPKMNKNLHHVLDYLNNQQLAKNILKFLYFNIILYTHDAIAFAFDNGEVEEGEGIGVMNSVASESRQKRENGSSSSTLFPL